MHPPLLPGCRPGGPRRRAPFGLLPSVALIQYTTHIAPRRLRNKGHQRSGGQRVREKTDTDPGAHHIGKISENPVLC